MQYTRQLVDHLSATVIGRRTEIEQIVASLAAGRHLVLEGPPGTGKSTVLGEIADALSCGFCFVEGNAELTPSRLIGSFDPAAVLETGYSPEVFLDGPLVDALRTGSLLYIEEINRIPEETLNVLVSVMSEGGIEVPRLGHIAAAEGFRLVAAMNPFDAVGTARISGAIYDRVCRLAMGYQGAEEEVLIVETKAPTAAEVAGTAFVQAATGLVRATRDHPDIRTGSSVRGAIDLTLVAAELANLRGLDHHDPAVTRDAVQLALSGRIRVREGCGRTAEVILEELWERFFAPKSDDDPTTDPEDSGGHEENPGKK